MRIPGADRAIGNLVKWSTKDDWGPFLESVFASHLNPIADRFDMTDEELAETLGEAFDMLYAVILEDFFTARSGDDGERNVIDDYLKRRGWRETVPAKRYLAAIRESTISLYEVIDIDPGRTMTVRDLIRGGDPVTIEEKMGSESAVRWDRVAARLIKVNKKLYFTGGMLLLSHESSNTFLSAFEETAKAVKAKLRREAKKQGGKPVYDGQDMKGMLLKSSGASMFTHAWLTDVLERIHAPLPEIRNTDGDEIVISEVRFPIAGDEARVTTVIDSIADIERDAPVGASWTWHGRGSPSRRISAKKHENLALQSMDDSGRTSLGDIEVKNGTVLLRTNSRERAERGRDLLASHLGPLVGPPLTSHEDIERMLDRSVDPRAEKDDEVPPEAAAEIMREYQDDHYRRALDDPLPMLDGKTPRQAVKTKKSRAQVIEWLKYLENSEYRLASQHGHKPYDMSWMWRELKLDEERQAFRTKN